jgi:hypothetical protein
VVANPNSSTLPKCGSESTNESTTNESTNESTDDDDDDVAISILASPHIEQ